VPTLLPTPVPSLQPSPVPTLQPSPLPTYAPTYLDVFDFSWEAACAGPASYACFADCFYDCKRFHETTCAANCPVYVSQQF